MNQFNQAREMRYEHSPVSSEERADFLQKTYLHLALAVLGFIVVEAIFLSTPFIVNIGMTLAGGWSWLIMLGGFMFATSIAEKWARESTDRRMQYGGLLLYVVAEAFIFVPLLHIAINLMGAPHLVKDAGMITLALFGGLTAIVFITGKDFSFLKGALTIGFFLALGLIVAGILFGFDLGLFFSFAMVALAAGSILYQTSNVLHEYNSDQYVAASLGLFASFMLLLWYVLSILMSMSGD